jgi:hypothetical protein
MAHRNRLVSMHLLLVVTGLWLLVAPAQAQTTWHVDGNAPGPGTGTLADPYKSIQYASNQVTTLAGDVLLVAPGVYTEALSLSKHVIIRSSGGPAVTELRPPSVIEFWAVLEGFTLFGKPTWPSDATIALHGGTLRGCVVRDNPTRVGVRCSLDGFIINSVVTGNATGVEVGVFDLGAYMHDSVIWGNTKDLENSAPESEIHHCAGLATVTGTIGTGNVIGDPELWDIAGGDYRPKPGSPCIDAGDPAGPLDPDGSQGDIGLYVYDPTYAPGPEVYCTGKLNSQGCVPAIGAIGGASATWPAPFIITASNEIPQTPGLLFFGFGDGAMPFQGAWHCVEPPTPRVGGQVSAGSGTCGGTLSFDMNAYIQSGVYPSLVPGEIVYCQWWSRDLQDPVGFGTGLTNALYFGIAP